MGRIRHLKTSKWSFSGGGKLTELQSSNFGIKKKKRLNYFFGLVLPKLTHLCNSLG